MKFTDFQAGQVVTFTKEFRNQDFQLFQDLSDDNNSLHWDASVGTASKFGRTIVPLGMAVCQFSGVAGMAFPGFPSIVLQQEFVAINPIPYDTPLTYSASIQHVFISDRSLRLSLRIYDRLTVLVEGRMDVKARQDEWEPPKNTASKFAIRNPGRVALVTGAKGAIGAAISNLLKKQNWDVHEAARGTAVDDRLGINLLEEEDRNKIASFVAEYRPDLVVHCASSPMSDPACNLIATNFDALEAISLAALPGMLANQSGDIIFLGSIAQVTHPLGFERYSGAKAMGQHFLQGLRKRYTTSGVRPRTLLSDHVRSEFSKLSYSASGESLEPEEVAEALLALLNTKKEGDYILDSTGLRPLSSSASVGSASDSSSMTVDIPQPSSQLSPPTFENDVRSKLLNLFYRTFPSVVGTPPENYRYGETLGWDSLRQITLMIEIESVFGVSFEATDISSAMSFDRILQLLLKAKDNI
ncbi:SDR family NAD(P)-dependent oxidoreductase [Agrobacterium vitis]|uniref:SDR family NAD(P)-dependent oxidoreductase n=1 Tax=Agrobacterium vitis TaxID=373 RepID=UPI0012E79331|nr:SDR family NAD(P)-dependent oxidoreductase [Agrobacterium vitis]MCF1470219.1 SDR family NAD(P)-dependent oxidoreductase [Agrobacterium vitis]MVA36888.1 SDR family NAD(P)-dependent oxidoreductase [Agrobacterium vitis]MVA82710.1 SDR family NAD(P)-dependent oxidoreductase [Agrobacterium vitis]